MSPVMYFSAMRVQAGPAQVAPKPACSITAATTILGLSAGAINTNIELSFPCGWRYHYLPQQPFRVGLAQNI